MVALAAMWPASARGAGGAVLSAASPGSGSAGSLVTIYGSGFDDPLMVTFSCWEGQLEVVAVSGTLIVVRFPTSCPQPCEDCQGEFTVTMLETGLSTTGGSFLFRGGQPVLYYVDPPAVDDAGATSSPSTIAIHGEGFAATVQVKVNGIYLDPAKVAVVSSSSIVISDLPGADGLFVPWQTVACSESGLEGVRWVQTSLDVSVVNIPPGCEDTLAGGLGMNPADTTCRVTAVAATIFENGFEDGGPPLWDVVLP